MYSIYTSLIKFENHVLYIIYGFEILFSTFSYVKEKIKVYSYLRSIPDQWSNYNMCNCIQVHPWCVIELKSSTISTCSVGLKGIFDEWSLRGLGFFVTLVLKWKYVVQICIFMHGEVNFGPLKHARVKCKFQEGRLYNITCNLEYTFVSWFDTELSLEGPNSVQTNHNLGRWIYF